jgi:methylthioribose-1-phosphate isomerase
VSVESNSPYTVFIDEAERRVAVLDQRLLPHRVEYVDLKNAQEAAEAIRDMTVRGAPLIAKHAVSFFISSLSSSRENCSPPFA